MKIIVNIINVWIIIVILVLNNSLVYLLIINKIKPGNRKVEWVFEI